MVKVTTLPVSGNGFISQLSILSLLGKDRGIILASSGGNLSCFIALACDYNPYGMERILRYMDSSLYLKSWWPGVFSWLPSIYPGFFRGSFYDSGDGVNQFFRKIFSPKTISSQEIWIGTTDCSTGRSQLFCNLSEGSSKLKTKYFRREEYNTQPLKYLNCDIDAIATISLASSAIPGIVPRVRFGDNCYIDGGSTFSSPLPAFTPVLRRYKELHIDYINSFDVEAPIDIGLANMSTLIRTITSEMIHSMILNDRAAGISLIRSCDGKMRLATCCCCSNFLQKVEEFRKKCKRTMLEIYPEKYLKIELDNYKAEDAIKILWYDRKNFRSRFWYISDEEFIF